MSSFEKKIYNLTLTFQEFGEKCQYFKHFSVQLNSQIILPARFTHIRLKTMVYSYPTLNTFTYNISMVIYHYILCISIQIYMFRNGQLISKHMLPITLPKAKEKYRGVFEIQKSGDKTRPGEIGLDIRAHASPKVGQDQVSRGESVLCWHVFYGNLAQ